MVEVVTRLLNKMTLYKMKLNVSSLVLFAQLLYCSLCCYVKILLSITLRMDVLEFVDMGVQVFEFPHSMHALTSPF